MMLEKIIADNLNGFAASSAGIENVYTKNI
jgi:hypothetical protein